MVTKYINELLEQIELLKNENKQLKSCKKFGLVWEEKLECTSLYLPEQYINELKKLKYGILNE